MATIWKHAEDDWCHICGHRRELTVDVCYPENAEHDRVNTKYIRICNVCAEDILDACKGYLIETTPCRKSSWG